MGGLALADSPSAPIALGTAPGCDSCEFALVLSSVPLWLPFVAPEEGIAVENPDSENDGSIASDSCAERAAWAAATLASWASMAALNFATRPLSFSRLFVSYVLSRTFL
jgi:hypothetical protein